MKFLCPICQGMVAAEQSLMGQQVQCGHCSNAITVPETRVAPGAIIGDFVIQRELGIGGMGVVYLSHQLSLDRPAALKLLSRNYAENTGFVEGFIKEARSAAKLNHPNIVQAYAVGEDEGIFYFAMEYIDGLTMKEVLAKENLIAPDRAISIIEQIVNALDYAWKEERLIHRDIKPDNIMLTTSGRAKLADLGLAKMAEDPDSEGDTIMGTPQYISPEHLTGEPMDIRSDIYSLGATFYQFITGDFPYNGASAAEIAQQHLTGNLCPPDQRISNLPAGLSEVIVKMMASHADSRYSSAEELLADLRAVKNGEFVPSTPPAGNPPSPGIQVAKAVPQAIPISLAPTKGQAESAPAVPAAPQGLSIPGSAPAAPAAPQGLSIPGSAPAAPAAPQGLSIPGSAPAAPAAPQGLSIPGSTPAAPANPAPPVLKPAGPGGLSLKKEEKKKEEPPKEEKKEEDSSGKDKKDDGKKKEKTDLANPLMKERQEKQKQKKKKKLIITLSTAVGIILILIAALFAVGVDKVKNSFSSLYNKVAKKANLEPIAPPVEESPLVKEMKKLLKALEDPSISRAALFDRCEEFMATKPEPVSEEEIMLYQKIRTFFVPVDAEKCEKARDEDDPHSKYLANIENIRRAEARKASEERRKKWEEAVKAEAARKAAERQRVEKQRRDAEERFAKGVQSRIQIKRHKKMLEIRRAFYEAFFDFETTLQEKHTSVRALQKEATLLSRAPSAADEPDYDAAKKILGGRFAILRPDTIKLRTEMNNLYNNSCRFPNRIDMVLRKGDKRFRGTSIILKNLACKVEKVEDFTIYAKLPGSARVYKTTFDDMRENTPRQFRSFIREAFGSYGLNLEAYLPVYFALNGNVKMASFLGEGPLAAPAAKKNLTTFYQNYFDYVLKQNRNNKEMRAKLVSALGNTQNYRDYLNPPKPAPRKVVRKPAPKKVIRKAPAKKAAPKKAAPKKAPAKKK